MNIREYISKIRCGVKGLSSPEIKVLGVTPRGNWLKSKRSKKDIISDETLVEIYKEMKIEQASTGKINPISVNMENLGIADETLLSESLQEQLKCKKKFVYLMKNSLGMFKIGISSDPRKRARDLSNSSR